MLCFRQIWGGIIESQPWEGPLPPRLRSLCSLRSTGRWAWSFGPRTLPGVGSPYPDEIPLWVSSSSSGDVIRHPQNFSGGPVFHPVEQCQANPASVSTSQVVVAVIMLLSGALFSSLNALIPPYSSRDTFQCVSSRPRPAC